jgi:hypothetical protein
MFGQAPGTVEIYKDNSFSGSSSTLRLDGSAERGFETIPRSVGNDEITSVKVGKGVKAHLYHDSGFRGCYLVLYEGQYTHIIDYNDAVSSIKLFKIADDEPLVTFYEHKDRGGVYQNFGVGSFEQACNLLANDWFSSVYVPEGMSTTVFHDKELNGGNFTFEPGFHNLDPYGFNDAVSSVTVARLDYELVEVKYGSHRTIQGGNKEEIVGQTSSATNNGSSPIKQKLTINKGYESSYTTSFENSTTIGISTSISSSVTVGGEIYGASATVTTSITTELFNTTTFGEAKTTTKTIDLGQELEVEIPPGQKRKAILIAKPVKLEQDVELVYRPKEGKKGKEIREKCKLVIDTAVDSHMQVDDPDPSPPAPAPAPPSEPSGNNTASDPAATSDPNAVTFTIQAPPGKTVILEGRLEIRDGNVVSVPAAVSGPAGNGPAGRAIEFNDKGDFIEGGSVLSPSYTKEAWIKMTPNNGQANNIISGGAAGQHAFYAPSGQGYRVSAGHNGKWDYVKCDEPASGGWQHYAVTYDANTSEMKLYKNGEMVSSATNVPAFSGGNFIQLGRYDTGHHFFGEMADVRVWNYVRTKEQIAEKMNQSIPREETGLIAKYPID